MNQYILSLTVSAEEKYLVAHIDELAQKALQGISMKTDFLDLRQQVLGEAVAVQYSDISWKMDGGFETAERKRLLLSPAWEDATDKHIHCLHIKASDNKYDSLGHRDYLGAIMNLGIKREKIGDILVKEREAYALVDEIISDYICQHLERVAHSKVETSRIDIDNLILPISEPMQINCTIQSLRLDAVLAAAFRISRSEAAALIETGRVQLNHQLIGKGAVSVKAEDLLSVRGKGRICIDEIGALTKKGRYRVCLSKW